jgi:hypothetical protein
MIWNVDYAADVCLLSDSDHSGHRWMFGADLVARNPVHIAPRASVQMFRMHVRQ